MAAMAGLTGSRASAPPVQGLHHWAHRCRDAEETRRFHEDVLGLPLMHVICGDRVLSSGDECSFLHLFFLMRDGWHVAFFDMGDDQPAVPSANTPPWVNHLALRVDSATEVLAMKARLGAHGVQVWGVIDHGFVQSIYFFDPNGIRMAFTTPTASDAELAHPGQEARGKLDAWNDEKVRARQQCPA